MHWVLIIFAILAIAGAAGCFWYRARLGQEIVVMTSTATSRAADVASAPTGSRVEVKGQLQCTAPLMAEFSGQPCVYHRSEITREVVYYTTSSDGKRERKTRNETVHSNIQHAACVVRDDSGSVVLKMDGADVEGNQVVNRREQEDQSPVTTLLRVATGSNETSTLKYSETILAADIPVYVLGEVQPDHTIGAPAIGSKNRIFVVSQKTEEQRTGDLRRTMVWLLVGTIVLAVLSLVLGYFAITVRQGGA